MTTNLKAKLLQHFVSKKANGGFTLIELLVVIIIIGILSAIALPSFLNQGNKARESEAKTYVGSMNRAQQAYYTENAEFAENLGELGLGVDASTENYEYAIDAPGATVSGATGEVMINKATAQQDTLKNYAGPVAVIGGDGSTDADGNVISVRASSVLCEADDITKTTIGDPTVTNGAVDCPTDMTPVD